MMEVKDMPKLLSPFVREHNEKGDYVITPQIEEGYDWVFNDPDVLATEKLDGTNVSIIIENGTITSVWNRTARIPFFCKGKEFIIEGVLEAFKRGYCDLPDGQHFGECIGEKLAGNPYQIKGHLWIPFVKLQKECAYKSYHNYPKTFENIKKWFESKPEDGGIVSRFMMKKKVMTQQPEGVVFFQPSTGRMAKLRRDMMPDFVGRRHEANTRME